MPLILVAAAMWLLAAAGSPGPSTAAPGPVPSATPAPRPSPRLVVTADELRADAAARVVSAAGRVRITDGVTTATAERATLYYGEGRGVLTGQARVVAPQGVLEGAEITVLYTSAAIRHVVARGKASMDVEGGLVTAVQVSVVPEADTISAQGEVVIFTPPDIIATGARLVYRRARGEAVLEGRARVQTRDGFVQCERIEAFDRWKRVKASGGVHAILRDMEIHSAGAEVFLGEQRAVFEGDVRLVQAGRHLSAEKLTVWYAAGRFVAEGQIRARIEATP